MLMCAIVLLRPKAGGLRVMRTVFPDVRLDHRRWVLHHRKVNHIELR